MTMNKEINLAQMISAEGSRMSEVIDALLNTENFNSTREQTIREECAKICDARVGKLQTMASKSKVRGYDEDAANLRSRAVAVSSCAKEIRALNKTPKTKV